MHRIAIIALIIALISLISCSEDTYRTSIEITESHKTRRIRERTTQMPTISEDYVELVFRTSLSEADSIAVQDNYIWVSDRNKMYRLDHHDGSIIASVDYTFSGLVFADNYLYGVGGAPATTMDMKTIYKMDPEDATILSSLPLAFQTPDSCGMGFGGSSFHINSPCSLAYDGNDFWLSTICYDSKIYRVDPSDGSLIESFDYKETFHPAGLAHDGKNLWVAEFNPDMIHKVNPENGSILSSFAAPSEDPRIATSIAHLTGLDFDDEHYLWVITGGPFTGALAGKTQNVIYKIGGYPSN